mgnify:CR=1 FL=1
MPSSFEENLKKHAYESSIREKAKIGLMSADELLDLPFSVIDGFSPEEFADVAVKIYREKERENKSKELESDERWSKFQNKFKKVN